MSDDGYEPIDWSAPFDPGPYLEGVPPEAQIRGMFIDKVCQLASEAGGQIAKRRYIGFKLYPLKEHMTLMIEAVSMLYPDEGLREGLRRLGAHATPTLRESMLGRVFTSLVGERPESVVSLLGKSYNTTRNVGTAEVLSHVTRKEVVIGLREVHDFPDCLHVGIFEAVMKELGEQWAFEIRRHGLYDCDVRCRVIE